MKATQNEAPTRGRGRPKGSGAGRSKAFMMRVSEEELVEMERKASEAGHKNVSSWVRQVTGLDTMETVPL